MARRPNEEKVEIFSEKDLAESPLQPLPPECGAVRDAYERAHQDCRMIYSRIPTPKQMQTLVQIWKQLWRWRR